MNNLVKTIFLLIFTLIVVPVATFYLDEPLMALQKETLQKLLLGALVVALLCYVVSEITGNCSQVDKLWSVVPVFYVWYMAYKGSFDPRLILMAFLVTVWGVRLTYNFSRRGAYKLKFWTGEEDYRWEILRQAPALKGRLRWSLFNLFFISLYQNGLILLFTLPMLVAYKSIGQPLTVIEYLLAVVFIVLVILETLADQQQWKYQNEKHRRLKANIAPEGVYKSGFVHTGLWAKMRHPNYACEQAIWIVFYLFSVIATGHAINWSMAGSLLLLILFQGSANFSENISAGKYPDYKDYQKQTGRFLPKLFREKLV
jgi:steroid 5-alpha reductase family enzyme